MMKFLKEFKAFAMKGNVMDLAVGVIIGSAFGKIVSSLVNDIFMPLITLVTGKNDFNNLFIQLDQSKGKFETFAAANEKGVATVNFGVFITNTIDFLIIALVIFIFVRQINRFKPKPAPVVVNSKECPFCKTSIHKEATKCPNCTSNLKA